MAFMHLMLIFLVLNFAQVATGQTVPMSNTTNQPAKLYGGKTAEGWVSEVVRLAVTIRATEENYEKSLRECVSSGRSVEDNTAPPCIRANHSRFAAESARNEYQRLLNKVSRTSLPVEWLRANFTWVRFGQEWRQ